jgi:signal transduction histidine kinase
MFQALRRSFSAILNPIPKERVLNRYIVAALAGILAILLRWLLDPVLGHVAFYVTIYIAVVYCAIVCGYVPATLAAVLGFAGIFYWFVDPRHTVHPVHLSEIHGIVGFILVSVVLIALGEANRSKHLRLNESVLALTREIGERQCAQRDLRAAHDQLEIRVQERTLELFQALSRLQSEVEVREHAEEELRQLSVRLMTLQDEERRRIARELHDTAGQTLAAMKMSIALIRPFEKSCPELQVFVDDLNALADAALQEVRTASYLLHPPLLDEAGIASAARWFAQGFAQRSGIDVTCDIPETMQRPSRDCELVLFRILQESLTNVHRHSGASAANIRLHPDDHILELEIADNGKGIPAERLRRFQTSTSNSGVGIAGMRERVRQLAGHLELRSSENGTTVFVSIPTTGAMHAEQSNSISIAS